jgi:hypothetical protein
MDNEEHNVEDLVGAELVLPINPPPVIVDVADVELHLSLT